MALNEYPILRNQLELDFPDHSYCTKSYNEPRLPLPGVHVIRKHLKNQFINVWNTLPN